MMKVLLLLFLGSCSTYGYGAASKKLRLSSGYQIPVVGLGTSAIDLNEIENAISNALDIGYRHFDTAFSYGNEAAIGKVLKKWFDQGGKREDLFVTSKLPPQANRPASVEKYLNHSLENLGLTYLDMYLVHAPYAIKEGDNYSESKDDGSGIFDHDVDHLALWKEMEKQVVSGRAKSIGLSNFNQTQVLKVYNSAKIKPSNLQVESHAYLQQKKLRAFCKRKQIIMTAYAPLGSMKSRESFYNGTEKNLPALIKNPVIEKIAAKYKKSPAQILLRHSIQDGLVVIPKSSNFNRLKENIELFNFRIYPEDFRKISALDIGEKGRVFDFLNFYKNLDKNAHYPFAGSAQ